MISIPKKISQKFYKINQNIKGNAECFSYLEDIKKSQFYSQKEIKTLQWQKLKELLFAAEKNCPYYTNLFKQNNIKVSNINTYEDFIKIPLLDKDDVRNNLDDLISKEFKKEDLILNHSSGSTGQPLAFYQTKDFKIKAKAHQLRNYEWCGYEIGNKFALLWGSELYFKSRDLLDKLDNVLLNRIELNTFRLTEESLKKYALKLSKFSPKLISTYVSSIYLIGRVIEKYNLPKIKVGAIQTTSEPVSDFYRSFIKDHFGVDVYDKYGSRETNVIGHECVRHDGLHVNSENTFVEFLRDGQPVAEGEIGEIVVTNLNNHGMPLIRYRMHDLGRSLPDCDCGLGLPKMSNVIGRKSDMIVTTDGGFVDSYLFPYILMRFKAIDMFQVVQDKTNEIKVILKLNSSIDDDFEAEVTRLIHKFADQNFDVIFVYVDEIPTVNSGKHRLTISNVDYKW